jgi:hypothetical protein
MKRTRSKKSRDTVPLSFTSIIPPPPLLRVTSTLSLTLNLLSCQIFFNFLYKCQSECPPPPLPTRDRYQDNPRKTPEISAYGCESVSLEVEGGGAGVAVKLCLLELRVKLHCSLLVTIIVSHKQYTSYPLKEK